MNTATRLHKQGQDTIIAYRNTVKAIWETMCAADNIPAGSKFVIFSEETNAKYEVFYNKALNELRQAIAEYQAGGYVGLRIVKGRAI